MTDIRIEYPSIDEAEFEGNPVLRGVIQPSSLRELRIDNAYQREFLSATTRRYILDALVSKQRLPDIELGMRGESWTIEKDGIVLLHDPVYIIDGQQRRGTILEYLNENTNATVRQGALIHFNSTMEWERTRFHTLNLHQTRVAGGILLRNLRSTNPAVATFYGLSVTEKDFPLRNRISWNQTLARKDLLSATAYVRVTLTLHGHIGSGIVANSIAKMGDGSQHLAGLIGLPTLRENIKTFWGSIDTIWGISGLNRTGATWMRMNFLLAYANVLSDHRDFWDKNKLKIETNIIEKLKRFPINNPEIKSLVGAQGMASKTLEYHLLSHLNKNSRKLLDRRPDTAAENRRQNLKQGRRNAKAAA